MAWCGRLASAQLCEGLTGWELALARKAASEAPGDNEEDAVSLRFVTADSSQREPFPIYQGEQMCDG